MCLGGGYAKEENNVYGRVQAGRGEAGQAARCKGHAHARDLSIEQSVLRQWVSQEHGGVLDMRSNKPLRSESASEVERLNGSSVGSPRSATS